MISSFVLIMMLLIEYINVQTQGAWHRWLRGHRWKQYALGAFLGAIPGCLGAFTVVSLYTHKLMTIGSVVTAMIATSGDEAFVMFSMFPQEALLITGLLIITGLVAGLLTDRLFKNPFVLVEELNHQLPLHQADRCNCYPKGEIRRQLKQISFPRAMLMGLLGLLVFLFLSGSVGPESWNWKRVTFTAGSLFTLFVVTTVPDHFLEEHLWKHILKKHLPRIFLWTFGTLLVLEFLAGWIDIEHWIADNLWWVLLISVLVGIIPESGPHLVFVTLFAAGSIPFSILMVSSIVQDGHGMLPLLAESKKSFAWVKAINVTMGLLLGSIAILFQI